MSWLAIAVAGSIGLWLAAVYSLLRVQRLAGQRLPGPWRDHPDLIARRDAQVSLRFRPVLDSWRPVLPWFGLVLAFALLLALVDVKLPVQIAAAVLLAAYQTHGSRAQDRQELSEIQQSTGLETLARTRWISAWYTASLFTAWLAFLLTGVLTAHGLSTAW